MRSVQNLLNYGWPRFECGGAYTRGLLLQYLAAPLTLLTANVEAAPRFVSAVSSVLAWPAAYIIGCRIHSRTVGLLAVAILALSVWETEMARFGRMYAPFQTVFLWYLVCFLKRTLDDDQRADWFMVALTVVGTLLWEGGVFLALTNFLPLFLQRRSTSLSEACAAMLKFVPTLALSYWFVATDFRTLGGLPSLPLDYASVSTPTGSVSLWNTLLSKPWWLTLFILPLGVSVWSGIILWRRREGGLTTLGLFAALTAALANQLLAAVSILLLSGLFRPSSQPRFPSPATKAVLLAVGALAVFWVIFACTVWTGPLTAPAWKALLSLLFPLLREPDLVDQVLRPWAAAVPLLSLSLLVLLAIAVARVLKSDAPQPTAERALLAIFTFLLLAACASDTPRHETRYVFFLYPIAVIVALSTIATLTERFADRRSAAVLTPLLAISGFALTEDFQLRHLLRVDQPATIFKYNLTPAQQEHLVTRDDTRSLAQWLSTHARRGDSVVDAVQGLDFYDHTLNYFYVDRTDFNFESYSCQYGTRDRWSNLPLLQSTQDVGSVISRHSTTYVVTYSTRVAPLITGLLQYRPQLEWSQGHLAVVAFSPRANRAPPL